MQHQEIRAIRGSLSRPAFARLLGVSSLTVLRWELVEGSKEARRPRPRMIEALRKLAAEGVGTNTERAPQGRDEDDDDLDVSELPPSSDAPAVTSTPASPFERDRQLVLPLLERLNGESWQRAEAELVGLVASSRFESTAGRALATLGLVQARLIGRLDIGGALTTLMPFLEQAENGKLPPEVAARAHTLAAFLFSSMDSRFFDPGRVNAHAARAEELLPESERDQRVLLVTAQVTATRFVNPAEALHATRARSAIIDHATSPLAQLFAANLRAVAAEGSGDDEAMARYGSNAFAIAERLGLAALVVSGLAHRSRRMLRATHRPEAVLALTELARKRHELARTGVNEPLLQVLASEIEALRRAGRVSESNALADFALKEADAAGLPRYSLAIPVARAFVYGNRVSELGSLANTLEVDASAARRGASNLHAVLVRAMAASLAADPATTVELAERVCGAPDSAVGIDYLRHDAFIELAYGRLALNDVERAEEALRRAEDFARQLPSVWHSADYMRLSGYLLMHRARYAEARQRLEASMAVFGLLGDVIQSGLARLTFGILARVMGAPDAAARIEDARRQLGNYVVIPPELSRRGRALSEHIGRHGWHEPSLTERLVVAIDRLSIQGLDDDGMRNELRSILGDLFPGRDPIVGPDDPGSDTAELGREGSGVCIGVRGRLDPDQRAALGLLARAAPLVRQSNREAVEPEIPMETLLPHFIAVSPPMKQVRADVARLARSLATILILGESGTGKEVVARAIHDVSARASKAYVVFNCASVPRDLFESQLFGHKKGSFTGAVADSLGVIRAADGGTLFLDEIGELPLEMQPKLLRFLENGEVLPIGEQRARRITVRVVAATHRDLGRLVGEGTFREDLYYRLNVVPLRVPPLRERKDDVLALARHFAGRLAAEGTAAPAFSESAVAAFHSHSWPGNVRELRNVIERAMAYAPVPEVLDGEHLRIAT
jgi:tetratricopeptide (TPR) repeat protein